MHDDMRSHGRSRPSGSRSDDRADVGALRVDLIGGGREDVREEMSMLRPQNGGRGYCPGR